MTDLEIVRDLLTRAGIHFVEPAEDMPDKELTLEIPSFHPGRKDAHDEGPNRGYSGFVSIAGFDKADGHLVWWGAWE